MQEQLRDQHLCLKHKVVPARVSIESPKGVLRSLSHTLLCFLEPRSQRACPHSETLILQCFLNS